MNEAFSPALRPEAPQETGRVSRKTPEPAVSVVSATDVRLTEAPARPGGVCITSSHLFRAGVAAHSAVSAEGTPLVQTRCSCGGTEAARCGGGGGLRVRPSEALSSPAPSPVLSGSCPRPRLRPLPGRPLRTERCPVPEGRGAWPFAPAAELPVGLLGGPVGSASGVSCVLPLVLLLPLSWQSVGLSELPAG